jgi:hypothetical protein
MCFLSHSSYHKKPVKSFLKKFVDLTFFFASDLKKLMRKKRKEKKKKRFSRQLSV